MTYWGRRFYQGASPYDIALGIAASAEREGARVRDDYQTYLGRAPSQQEVDYWVGRFVTGLRNEDVAAGFLSAPEFYFSPTEGKGFKAGWIRVAYLDILQRSATANDVAFWTGVLG
jgi:Domain of unknown function (DUF4214)